MGFWEDAVSMGTAGASDLVGITHSNMPTLLGYLRNPQGNFFTAFNRLADPTGMVEGGAYHLGKYVLPSEVAPYASSIGAMIGSIWGPGGAAAGSHLGDVAAAGNRGQNPNEMDSGESVVKAGTVAAMAGIGEYLGGLGGGEAGGTAGGATGGGVDSIAYGAAETVGTSPAWGEYANTGLNIAAKLLGGGKTGQQAVGSVSAVGPPRVMPSEEEAMVEPPKSYSNLSGKLSPATETSGLLAKMLEEDDEDKMTLAEYFFY